MLLGKNTRHMVRHELVFRPERGHGAALPFQSGNKTQDVANVLKKAIAANAAAFEVKANDVVRITKLDIRPKDGIAVLLVRRRDEEASPQVFEHGATGKLRKPPIDPKEAPAISAHLVLRLTQNPGPHPAHRAILEEVPGLGRTYIQYILQRVLKPAVYSYKDPKGKVKQTYTIPSINGVPSETLGDALAGGAIKYVELVRKPQLVGLDMAGLVPHQQRLKLSVKPDYNPLDLISRVQDWARDNDWSNVKVQVETSDERTKVVEIARGADAADILFVRSEIVTTEKPIDVCTDVINEELVGYASQKLLSDDNW